MKEVWIRNRQRRHPVDVQELHRLTQFLLESLLTLEHFQLGIHFVGPRAMAGVNQRYLTHQGPTDVITFNHAGPDQPLYGELFICPEVAAGQALEFHTSRADELVRYVVHGVLHLQGYDDATPVERRRMKRLENRLFQTLRRRFPLSESGGRPRVSRKR